MTFLRIPRLSNVENVVQYADTSVNSEISAVAALGTDTTIKIGDKIFFGLTYPGLLSASDSRCIEKKFKGRGYL